MQSWMVFVSGPVGAKSVSSVSEGSGGPDVISIGILVGADPVLSGSVGAQKCLCRCTECRCIECLCRSSYLMFYRCTVKSPREGE